MTSNDSPWVQLRHSLSNPSPVELEKVPGGHLSGSDVPAGQ